jgi:peptidyl-tRNA hydrolase, PTH1 family
MNESGPPIASLARKHGVDPEHVIAVHDEIDLSFGALRVKVGGSTAGHNGLRSLERALRTPDFYRVRLGVGRPPGRQDPGDYVLDQLPKRDEAEVAALVDVGADAVLSLLSDGLQTTQDRYNRSAPRER